MLLDLLVDGFAKFFQHGQVSLVLGQDSLHIVVALGEQFPHKLFMLPLVAPNLFLMLALQSA